MVKVAPSILSADFSQLQEELRAVSTAEWIHIDVMDGHFVPNITLGPGIVKALRPHTEQRFDTHLMITDPARYADAFIDAGSDHITFHLEAVDKPEKLIEHLHSRGVKAGLSLRPKTPITALSPYLDDVDLILVMSVEPGFGGQVFMPESVAKIQWLAAQKSQRHLDFEIVVDGGINRETAQLCAQAGATVLVAGAYVFGASDRAQAIKAVRYGR